MPSQFPSCRTGRYRCQVQLPLCRADICYVGCADLIFPAQGELPVKPVSGTVSFLVSVMYDFYLLDQGKIVQCSFRWLRVIPIVIYVLAHAKYLPHPLDGITVFVLSYKFKFHLRLTEDEAAGVLQYLPFQLYFCQLF